MSNLGGFRRGDTVIYFTHFPNLKKPVLAIGNGCVVSKIASFDSEEAAEGFYAMLCDWLGVKMEDQNDRAGD